MHVVSLAPSATATVAALGGAGRLVGVTTHCDVDAPVVGGWLNPTTTASPTATPTSS